MKSTCIWKEKFQSVVDNGRGHSIAIDLPLAKGGDNTGATALEMLVMSLNGCIGTIFALVAQKMRIGFTQMELLMFAEQENNAPTITYINFELSIKTEEAQEKIEKCLDTTLKTCPVGVLFDNAGVEITYNINYL